MLGDEYKKFSLRVPFSRELQIFWKKEHWEDDLNDHKLEGDLKAVKACENALKEIRDEIVTEFIDVMRYKNNKIFINGFRFSNVTNFRGFKNKFEDDDFLYEFDLEKNRVIKITDKKG